VLKSISCGSAARIETGQNAGLAVREQAAKFGKFEGGRISKIGQKEGPLRRGKMYKEGYDYTKY
jgi:hypothetical protein